MDIKFKILFLWKQTLNIAPRERISDISFGTEITHMLT